ncbi:hypothetical protein HK104_001745 [Borealophlyctis nickersoniae]|nr:hypothetical protein HK104_001745 [Borealophlyctis nickersoniae]
METVLAQSDKENLLSRQAAAISFLSSIVLARDTPQTGTSAYGSYGHASRRGSTASALHPKENVSGASGSHEPRTGQIAADVKVYNEKEQAAVDFLLHISLEGSKPPDPGGPVNVVDLSVYPAGAVPFNEAVADTGEGSAGARQSSAQYVPPSYQLVSGKLLDRYRATTSRRSSTASAGSIVAGLLDHNVTMTTPNGVPMSVFSVISHKDTRSKPRRQRTRSKFSSQYLDKLSSGWAAIDPAKRKKHAASYAHLLEGSNTLVPKSTEPNSYHPFFLDDPELKIGKHKTVLTLPCFMGSIIQYSKPSDIKKELNEHFRETHPSVDPSITLTQIRNLKEKMLAVADMQDLEFSSVASAYVYFEKLVLKNMVSKFNRRLIAGENKGGNEAVKVNDPKEVDYSKLLEVFTHSSCCCHPVTSGEKVIDTDFVASKTKAMDKVLDVSPKEVYATEFSVYAALEFTLFLPLSEIMPHLERILDASKYGTVEEYLGNRTFFLHG